MSAAAAGARAGEHHASRSCRTDGARYTAMRDTTLRVRAGRVRLGGRPDRLRQVHAAQRRRRPAAALVAAAVQVFGEPLAGINRAPATCSRPKR